MNLRDQHDWKMLKRRCRTDICSWKISAKVYLILDNPFLVPSLSKLNHHSLRFIQISTKSAYFLQEKQCFFWSHPWCFGPLGKFQHNIKISIKATRVSRLCVSCDYDADKIRFFQKERKLQFNTTHGAVNIYLQNDNVQRQEIVELDIHNRNYNRTYINHSRESFSLAL